MDTWKILNKEEIKFEDNSFIEFTLKERPNSNDEVIAISKGWFKKNGDKLYKSNILFPKSKKEEIIEILKNL